MAGVFLTRGGLKAISVAKRQLLRPWAFSPLSLALFLSSRIPSWSIRQQIFPF